MLLNRTVIVLAFAALAWTGASQAQEEEGPGIAVLDTGTNAVGVNVVEGFNFLNGTTDFSDTSDNNHGTTVSQIINQEAPGVPQHQFVTGFSSASARDAALLRAAGNPDVDIIAVSAANVDVPSGALVDASTAGKFVAVRTGNDGGENPTAAAVAANGLPGVVIVTGTNGAGGLLANSNACGVTADRCVGVRGTTEFNNISGTSFATARMAGIAAEVLRNSPFLSAEDLAGVIFATAEDTGDPRLGNGFIANAGQVINNPAGPSGVGDGGGSSVAAAALLVGAAAGAALLFNDKGEEELEKTLILDSFGRPFHVDLTELARIEDDRSSISRFFTSLEQHHDSTTVQLSDHHTLNAAYVTSDLDVVDPGKYFAFEDDPAFREADLDWALSLSGEYPNGFHYQVDRNRDPSLNFGVMDTVYQGSMGGRAFLSGQSFAVPLLGFSATADSAAFGFQSDGGFGLDFGLVNTNENRAHGRESVAAVVDGSYSFDDRAEVSLQIGHLQEDGSLFGGASNGTFSVEDTDTLAASISATLRVGERTRLIGNYGVARSDVEQADAGLLKNFSSLHSNWFGVGLVTDGMFRVGDQIGVAFSQPLRVTSGEVDMHVPYARDYDGNIYKNTERVSLEPGGNEYTLESYYIHPLGRRSAFGAYVMLRQEPNHVADFATELTVLASYRARF